MSIQIKKQLTAFFTEMFDKGTVCSDMGVVMSGLYRRYTGHKCYEFATTQDEFIEFAKSIGIDYVDDVLCMKDQELCELKLGREPKIEPKFNEDTEFESIKSVAYKVISCALARLYESDREEFIQWILKPHQLMKYIVDNKYKAMFNKKKHFDSTETLVIATVKKYLTMWGFYVTKNRTNGVPAGTVCICTDEQYEVFTGFLEHVDKNVFYC